MAGYAAAQRTYARPDSLIFYFIMMDPQIAVTVVMVEDNPDLMLTAQEFLRSEPRLTLLGSAAGVEQFRNLIRQNVPDLALIDIGLDTPRSGLDLLSWLAREFPAVKPIIMTVNQGDVLEAYQAGARGYVLKTRLVSLASVLLQVAEGKLIIPPEVSELLLDQMKASSALMSRSMELDQFSERELEILRFLHQELSREAIGEKLGISFYTVRRHVQNILEKTGLSSIRLVLDKFGEVLGRKDPFAGNGSI